MLNRKAILFAALAALAIVAFAQEEALTELEGRVATVKGAGGQVITMLRLANGDLVGIELPPGEAERLQLRARARIRVSGVFIGATAEGRAQARILARSIVRNGKAQAVADPVQLREQDRLQIRAYEEERLRIATRTQEQAQLQTQAQAQAQERESGGAVGESKSGKR